MANVKLTIPVIFGYLCICFFLKKVECFKGEFLEDKIREIVDAQVDKKVNDIKDELMIENEDLRQRLAATEDLLLSVCPAHILDAMSNNSKGHKEARRLTLVGSSANKVVFSVGVSGDAVELGAQHVIPFSNVMVNEGNGFDPITHFFTCPVTGVYTFLCSLTSDYHDHIEIEIVYNGNVLAKLYAAGSTTSHGFDQGFNAVATRCNAGEHVWVRVHDHAGTVVHGWGTVFTGFLNFAL